MIKTKYRVNRALLLITIVAMALTFWTCYTKNAELAEQAGLKSEIVDDCNNLTKQVVLLEKQNKLLEDKVQQQKGAIDRLMRLESVDNVKAVTMSEARGSTLEAQCAVMQTALDRSTSWNIPVKEAIAASGQYSHSFKGTASDSVNTAFDLVFLDGYRPFAEVTTHFHDTSIQPPYWAANKVDRGSIENFRFYN